MWTIPRVHKEQRIVQVSVILFIEISSVQFSRLVVSDSSWPHESQHARPPCSSPTPRVHWDSRPSSQWCHPAISSSVIPFSSCPQSLPASESLPMSQLFTWGGQSTGVSASESFPPKKSQGFIEIASSNIWVFQVALGVKNLPAIAGSIRDLALILGLGRSPGGGHGKLPHHSCLENPMDRGASGGIHFMGLITKSQTQLKQPNTSQIYEIVLRDLKRVTS